jgi:hypothetical protein
MTAASHLLVLLSNQMADGRLIGSWVDLAAAWPGGGRSKWMAPSRGSAREEA